MNPVVLVVDDIDRDRRLVIAALQWHLGNDPEILQAGTMTVAIDLFDANIDRLTIVTMDGCMEGRGLDTPLLVRYMRAAGYTGLLIGISSDRDYCKQLEAAGCNSSVNNFVLEADPNQLATLLG